MAIYIFKTDFIDGLYNSNNIGYIDKNGAVLIDDTDEQLDIKRIIDETYNYLLDYIDEIIDQTQAQELATKLKELGIKTEKVLPNTELPPPTDDTDTEKKKKNSNFWKVVVFSVTAILVIRLVKK